MNAVSAFQFAQRTDGAGSALPEGGGLFLPVPTTDHTEH